MRRGEVTERTLRTRAQEYLPLSLTCRLIITRQPREEEREGDCFCSVRSRVYSLIRPGGKGNMRARSQFAILWSYQMRRRERGREKEAAISIGRAASNQPARLPRTDCSGYGRRRKREDRSELRPGGRDAVSLSFPNSSRPPRGKSCASGTSPRPPAMVAFLLHRKWSEWRVRPTRWRRPSVHHRRRRRCGGGFLSALSERQAIINQSDCACHIRSTGSHRRTQRWTSDAAAKGSEGEGPKEGKEL